MIDKLEGLKERFEEVGQLMVQPDAMSDMKKFTELSKEYAELEKVVTEFNAYKKVLDGISQAKNILETEKDAGFREMAKMELDDLNPEKETHEEALKKMLIPKDPKDDKNAVLEIRAGTGGDEAAIFAGDLFKMYQRFCEKAGLALNVLDLTAGTSGGYKEIISTVTGKEAYGILKYESGVHRVQRVPATETQGRVHTSAATVAVLPEIDDVEVEIDMNDIRKDTYCSSGPGGQSVNTTYSAVRLTHGPTGLVVTCQDQKSQLKNFDKALKVLRSRLYEIEYAKQMDEVGAQRRTMVRSGDRSEKIRTYNYPQGRVTDHRIGYTVHNLPAILNGEIEDIIENLQMAETQTKLNEEAS
jgi:peptide chain release factor 1